MTEQDMIIWEAENKSKIIKWEAEWDIIPNFKIVTFYYFENGIKKTKKFEIELITKS